MRVHHNIGLQSSGSGEIASGLTLHNDINELIIFHDERLSVQYFLFLMQANHKFNCIHSHSHIDCKGYET